jgi:hypothetical protein
MSARDRLAFAVVLTVALIGAMWVVLVSPERGKVSSLSTQIATQRTALATAESQVGSARSAASEYVGHLHQISQVIRAVPQTSAEADLVATIDKLAGTNVDFRSLNLSAGAGTAAGPVSITMTFTFWASYQGLQSFLTALDNLTQTDGTSVSSSGRLFTVTAVALAPLAPPDRTAATITAMAYLQGATTGATGTAGASVAAPTGTGAPIG